MCKNHHNSFAHHQFYIRWIPEIRRFVFVNHSRLNHLECYHGRAVHLFPDDIRVPFHGAFLDHEMHVRGLWPYLPYYADRPISRTISWQAWVVDAPGDGGDDGDSNLIIHRDHHQCSVFESGHLGYDSDTLHPQCQQSTITFKDPIANPLELEAVILSSRQQPNLKAAQIEGQSWEGTAEENICKYLRIMHSPSA